MPYSDNKSEHWVFGFGSLMWLPGFTYEEHGPARVHGWHRRFSVVSTRSWGSEARPGLVVALHPGGSCLGRAFRIAPAQWPRTLAYLEKREQAYRFIEVRAKLPNATVKALTFASNRDHPRTAAALNLSQIVNLIGQGRGSAGSSRQYFEGIRQGLASMGQARCHLIEQISRELQNDHCKKPRHNIGQRIV